MSYAIYTTQGFILGSSPSGEASKIYSIYTEDFGLIRAKAQGVRLIRSKLRYNLDDYGFCAVSLVRGKEVWRVTAVERLSSAPKGVDDLGRARVLNLVRRLVQGEERNDALFAALLMLEAMIPTKETDVLARVLSALGYLDLALLAGASERETISVINKALKETQL
ncbi:MAG: recombination protein O N-terminal domain-containing protein [Patescibacteria group bacterium]|nr:recombination protein O N-terminal domain-containing protein [Patescibacteria group bacterium]MDE2116716.1 recombination protein O N-terminal domain-containing protein [Patescibacteria group bacterium]